MLLSVCMIVRDNAAFLALNLPVLKAYADELIIVDTGSVDDTIRLCREAGAKVFEQVWEDDFSAPRNTALSHASGQWILCLDSDEYVAPEAMAFLRDFLSSAPEGSAYKLPIYQNKLMEFSTSTQYHLRIKLIKNGQLYRYSGQIIEEIVEADGRDFGPLPTLSEVPIYHWGNPYNLSDAQWQAKKDRNIAILETLLSRESDPAQLARYAHQLGINYLESKRYDEAAGLFSQIMTYYEAGSLKWLEVGIKQAKCFLDARKFVECRALCETLLSYDDRRAEVWNLLGLCALMTKDFDEAQRVFLQSVKQVLPQEVYVDFAIPDYTYLNRFYLGLTYFYQGDFLASERYFEESIANGCYGNLLKTAQEFLGKIRKEVIL